MGYVPLTGSANITAPIAGAFSPDNTLFFVSTAGDNMIHYINIPDPIYAIAVADRLATDQPESAGLHAVSAGGVDAGCAITAGAGPSFRPQ